jgi:hypothetical protein
VFGPSHSEWRLEEVSRRIERELAEAEKPMVVCFVQERAVQGKHEAREGGRGSRVFSGGG